MKIRNAVRRLARYISPPKPRPLILMYHRIADLQIDHWDLAVSPARFREHLSVLRRSRYPLPLRDFVRHLAAGTLRSDAVALTFDDGYVDNLVSGKPILAAADVPATVFLATGYLDQPGEFWWDQLSTLVLLERRPRSFDLLIAGEQMHFDLNTGHSGDGQGVTQHSQREAVMVAIWRAIRRVGEKERQRIMIELQSILSDRGNFGDRGRAMTRTEVRHLISDGLFAIGAHTVTHPVLSELDSVECDREISESKAVCETLVEAPSLGFSYPYGDFSPTTRAAVESAGFGFACSSRHRPANSPSDLFALPRINIRNLDGDAFEQLLRSASAIN